MNFRDWLVISQVIEASLFDKDWDLHRKPVSPERMKKFAQPENKVCMFDAFSRDQAAIGSFARQSPENMAQVAMFSPLSARTLFTNLEQQFPVVVYLLRYMYRKKNVNRQELEEVLKSYFNRPGANTRSVVFGFKLDTVADIWNRRNRIYQQAMSMYNETEPEKSDTEGLMKLFSGLNKDVGDIAGIAPVKAGFVVQLLFGQAGCIDVHNIRIYKQLSDKLGWANNEGGKRPLPSSDIDPDKWGKTSNIKTTEKNLQNYLDVLERLKERGIGVKELWNIWVDFVGQIYKQAKMAKADEPALNPLDPQYKDMSGLMIKSKAPAWMLGGKGRKETDVVLPIASGEDEGGEISRWHRKAASDPDTLLKHSDISKHYPFLSDLAKAKSASSARKTLDAATAWKRRQGNLF